MISAKGFLVVSCVISCSVQILHCSRVYNDLSNDVITNDKGNNAEQNPSSIEGAIKLELNRVVYFMNKI